MMCTNVYCNDRQLLTVVLSHFNFLLKQTKTQRPEQSVQTSQHFIHYLLLKSSTSTSCYAFPFEEVQKKSFSFFDVDYPMFLILRLKRYNRNARYESIHWSKIYINSLISTILKGSFSRENREKKERKKDFSWIWHMAPSSKHNNNM